MERFTPRDIINPKQLVERVRAATPNEVLATAADITDAIRGRGISSKTFIDQTLTEIQTTDSLDEQAGLITFAFSVEKNGQPAEQTSRFLNELTTAHGYTDELSEPFKRFIDKRLRIANETSRHKVGDPEGTKRMLELLKANGDFFHDVIDIQNHFSATVSPVMPLNSTWNPLLTEAFDVRGAEGLWFVYANNKREEYARMMKQQMSSEWTGFNRFVEEPWDEIQPHINKSGNFVDIGSSIGISAAEITKTLDMQGSIILLDSLDPFRRETSLRVIDYANPERKLIPLSEALEDMNALLGGRAVTTLFGVDIGQPLSPDVEATAGNAALVHCANLLPYLPPERVYPAIRNALQLTSPQGGVLKFHNDDSLPIDNVLLSLALQRDSNRATVLPNLTKGKFQR